MNLFLVSVGIDCRTDPRFGYDYPAGAEFDDLAPWNEGFSEADFEEDYQPDDEED